MHARMANVPWRVAEGGASSPLPAGVKSKAWKKRYCVYEPLTKAFTYYADEKAAKADKRKKEDNRMYVTQSAPVIKSNARAKVERRLSKAAEQLGGLTEDAMAASAADGKYEFKFNTVDKKGHWRVFECYTESAQQYRFWLEAMPHWGSDLTMGWLHKRKHGSKKTSFDRR